MRAIGSCLIACGLAIAISGCSPASSEADPDYAYSDDKDAYDGDGLSPEGAGYSDSLADNDEQPAREKFDEDAAREAAEDEIGSGSYGEIGAPYGCTDDCSGHDAGFNWRRDNGYSVSGNSQSFEEGGRAFDEAVEQRVDEMRDDYEAGEEPDY